MVQGKKTSAANNANRSSWTLFTMHCSVTTVIVPKPLSDSFQMLHPELLLSPVFLLIQLTLMFTRSQCSTVCVFSAEGAHCTAPQRTGDSFLWCKPCPSERLLTLFNMSARFFMSITQMKWFALCVNHTFRRGMHGCRQLEVTWAPQSLISPGIPAISHSHLQARRIQPLFSSLWALC